MFPEDIGQEGGFRGRCDLAGRQCVMCNSVREELLGECCGGGVGGMAVCSLLEKMGHRDGFG